MKTLNDYGSQPHITSAFLGWQNTITLVVVKTEIVNGLAKEISRNTTFRGVIQPLSERKLMLKPEGERAWKWLMIHCFSGRLNLEPKNDRIIFNGEPFKIMADNDYSLNGFIEYHLVKDYEKAKCNEQSC